VLSDSACCCEILITSSLFDCVSVQLSRGVKACSCRALE
jgi:hypothetical protein